MWNPQGSRKRGRLAEKHINRSWEKELRPVARDRRTWKELVDNLCS
jgi:hypothetical protein